MTNKLVCWYFETSQPQTITSRLKTMFNLSPIYSTCKSSNHSLSKNHKISPDTNLHEQNIHKHQTQDFRKISPFGITPVKKARKARTRWYHRLSIYQHQILKKYKKKKWTEAIKNSKILYKCTTASTSALWQHTAHTTDHLTSPSC